MKKNKLVISALIAMMVVSHTAFAASGDIAGDVYSTDITTYMYNAPITSYNIGGKTCIDAEILNWHYGFDVYWYGDERHLDITDKGVKFVSLQALSGEIVESTTDTPGNVVCNYYETDIVTTLNGKEIESYNIGGRTVICAEAMREFGYSVDWNEQDRTLKISKPADFYKYETDYGVIKSMNSYSLKRTENSFINRGIIVSVDGQEYLINTKSNKIYVSPGGDTFISLSDLVAILNGECSMTESTETVETDMGNGIKDSYDQYSYTFSLNYDTSIIPELTEYNGEDFEIELIPDSGQTLDLPITTIVINGEVHAIKSFYGGKAFDSALMAVDGKVYIPTYILLELFGYDGAW